MRMRSNFLLFDVTFHDVRPTLSHIRKTVEGSEHFGVTFHSDAEWSRKSTRYMMVNSAKESKNIFLKQAYPTLDEMLKGSEVIEILKL